MKLQKKVSMLAMRKNFEFKVKKSMMDLLVLACIDMKCNWWLHATKLSRSTFFKIKKYIGQHTCLSYVLQRKHRQASSWLIAQWIKSKFKELDCVYKPNEIKQDMKLEFEINICYDKVTRPYPKQILSQKNSTKNFYQNFSRTPLKK